MEGLEYEGLEWWGNKEPRVHSSSAGSIKGQLMFWIPMRPRLDLHWHAAESCIKHL